MRLGAYDFIIKPADAPHGIWMMDEPPAACAPLNDTTLTVWSVQGIGLADLHERNASGIESWDAGRM